MNTMLRTDGWTRNRALVAASLFRDDRLGSCLATAIVLIATLALSACGGGGGDGAALPKTLVSIAVTPNSSDLPVGLTLQLQATGTFSDGTSADLTSTATWTSSNPAFAAVGAASGVATSIAPGSTVIMATASGTVSGT